MDFLKSAALGTALVAGTLAAALLGLYCFQLLIRTLLWNWKVKQPPPDILSWNLGGLGMTWAAAEKKVAEITTETIQKQQQKIENTERQVGNLLGRIIHLENKL